jgi:type II secretory pathway pseudopilin PulG
MRTRKNCGFTLVETVGVVGMLSLLLGVMAPAVNQARVGMRGSASAANLSAIGQGAGMYASDHAGRIFSFTWSPGVYMMPDGRQKTAHDDESAAVWQQLEILMRRTGRIEGFDRLLSAPNRLPHMRTRLLVLQDYLDRPFPDPMVADSADANLLQWQANPTDITGANNIPYAAGVPNEGGYDSPQGWNNDGVRQRWAYSSSYLSTTSAWASDGRPGENTYVPVSESPHLHQQYTWGQPGSVPLAPGRNFAEVAFPSGKVHMFEEFDRSRPGSPYFAYDHARPDKLMFDGSVNDLASGLAAPSRSPASPSRVWRQNYVPLQTFPVPLSGLNELTPLSQRYRWTYRGLKGLDYPMMSPKDAVAR